MPNNILAVCLDCGDTLVDEGTEDKDERGVSHRADLIPGADAVMYRLKELGYPLALVADGPSATFTNNLGPHGLYELFDVYAISEELGVSKPHPDIFHHALKQLGIGAADYSRVVMVGNNLSRDIKGANALGIISVWLDWAPRREKIPSDDSEKPQYTIKTPLQLLEVIAQIEQKIAISS